MCQIIRSVETPSDSPFVPPRETIVRTWLITHYVSHCGGQAGRALAAELGSFERTGSPITLSFKRGLRSGSTPIPQRAEASVHNGGAPDTRHITRWTRHTRGPDHSTCELRCGDVNIRMPRLAAGGRCAWWRSAGAASDIRGNQSLSPVLQAFPQPQGQVIDSKS